MPRKEISKKEFVAGLPASMPAAEVCAKGERIGIELTPKQVSNIRSSLKMKAASEDVATTKGPKLRRARTVTSVATTTVKATRKSSTPPGTPGLVLPPLSVPKAPRAPSLDSARVAVRLAAFRLGIVETRLLLDELEAQMNE